ncbi:MAG: hypothetical protein H7Z42_01260 [Roseiflexaceae bacterium]|nr:hypothetical protein [Roseiflexaceae bacterium]
MRALHFLRELGAVAIISTLTLILIQLVYQVKPQAHIGVSPSPLVGEFQRFYEAERQSGAGESVRWSEPQAAMNLPLPGQSVEVTLELASGEAAPVELRVRADAFEGRFLVSPEPRRYQFSVSPAAFESRLHLQLASASPVQTSADNRLRGVLVRDVTLRGDGRAPAIVLLLGLIAALASYGSLRLAGARQRLATLAAIGTSGALATALLFGAWQLWWLIEFRVTLAMIILGVIALDRLLRREIIAGTRWHILALCLLTLPLRFAFVGQPDVVGDQTNYFVPWAQWAHQHGLNQLYGSGTDYPPLFPLALAAIAGLADLLHIRFGAPLTPPGAFLLKLPAILADLGLVLAVYCYALRFRPPLQALVIASICALLPPLWINSAWWGQVDSLPMLAVVLALVFWQRADGVWSSALFAVALLLKFQAVVFAPLFGLLLLRHYGMPGLLRGAAAALATFAVVLGPLVLAGQGSGLLTAYGGAVNRYPFLSLHAYNLWALLSNGAGVLDWSRGLPGVDDSGVWLAGVSYHTAGLALLALLVLGVCALLLRRSDHQAVMVAALLLALGFYMLPTQMHERYILPVYPLLLLWLARERVARWPLAVLALTGTLTLLRAYPFVPSIHVALSPLPVVMAIAAANLAVLVWLITRAARLARAVPMRISPARRVSAAMWARRS